jgi:hypothetical protein
MQWVGCAVALVRPRVAHLVVVSRFLKFVILNFGKSFRIWTPVPTPRAPLCIDPGGSMKRADRLGKDVRPQLGASPGAATAEGSPWAAGRQGAAEG